MGLLCSIFSSQYNWLRLVSAILRFAEYVLGEHLDCEKAVGWLNSRRAGIPASFMGGVKELREIVKRQGLFS